MTFFEQVKEKTALGIDDDFQPNYKKTAEQYCLNRQKDNWRSLEWKVEGS